ncbi:DUF7837 family putative zinc-binding protein [Haloferax sulfurifontis]
MTSDSTILGRCPDCGEETEAYQSIIEFEDSDGSTGVFAECYSCDEVVRPEWRTGATCPRGGLCLRPNVGRCVAARCNLARSRKSVSSI